MTQPQEYRGYLPPQLPPQPEFTVPTTSQQQQYPTTPAAGNPFYQTEDQTQPPPQQQLQLQESTPPPPADTSTGPEGPSAAVDFPAQTQRPVAEFPNTEPAGFLVTNPPPGVNADNLQSNLDDVVHPPHIHRMDVQCSKDMMTIDVEFNKPYDGVIYSKVRALPAVVSFRFWGNHTH